MANVLTKSVPRLDPTDVEGSFVKIFDYLYNTMEQIDDTLSRQGVLLGRVNLPATAVEIEQLKGNVNALSSETAALRGQVLTLSTQIAQQANSIDTLNTQLQALTQRVEALEQGGI